MVKRTNSDRPTRRSKTFSDSSQRNVENKEKIKSNRRSLSREKKTKKSPLHNFKPNQTNSNQNLEADVLSEDIHDDNDSLLTSSCSGFSPTKNGTRSKSSSRSMRSSKSKRRNSAPSLASSKLGLRDLCFDPVKNRRESISKEYGGQHLALSENSSPARSTRRSTRSKETGESVYAEYPRLTPSKCTSPARLTHKSTKSKDAQKRNAPISSTPSCFENVGERLNDISSVRSTRSSTKSRNSLKRSYPVDSDQYSTPSSKILAGDSSQNVPARHSLTRSKNSKKRVVKPSHSTNDKHQHHTPFKDSPKCPLQHLMQNSRSTRSSERPRNKVKLSAALSVDIECTKEKVDIRVRMNDDRIRVIRRRSTRSMMQLLCTPTDTISGDKATSKVMSPDNVRSRELDVVNRRSTRSSERSGRKLKPRAKLLMNMKSPDTISSISVRKIDDKICDTKRLTRSGRKLNPRATLSMDMKSPDKISSIIVRKIDDKICDTRRLTRSGRKPKPRATLSMNMKSPDKISSISVRKIDDKICDTSRLTRSGTRLPRKTSDAPSSDKATKKTVRKSNSVSTTSRISTRLRTRLSSNPTDLPSSNEAVAKVMHASDLESSEEEFMAESESSDDKDDSEKLNSEDDKLCVANRRSTRSRKRPFSSYPFITHSTARLRGVSSGFKPLRNSSPYTRSTDMPSGDKAITKVINSDECVETNEEKVSSESESSDGEDNGIKIERIIASGEQSILCWSKMMSSINTSEVESGSRWLQDVSRKGRSIERFLVKWIGLSYLHCSWETEVDLLENVVSSHAKQSIATFRRSCCKGKKGFTYYYTEDERHDGEYFDPGLVTIDRVLGMWDDKEKEDGYQKYFMIRWKNAPYTESTYEFEKDLKNNVSTTDFRRHVNLFCDRSLKPNSRKSTSSPKSGGDLAIRRLYKIFGENRRNQDDSGIKEYQEILAKTVFPCSNSLRYYQAEGVSWLISNFINQRSSIMADEMGLGKTIQSCVYISTMQKTLGKQGCKPFLIVAPLSTLPHWEFVFRTWTPELNTIVYHGSASDRDFIRQHEFAYAEDRPKTASSNRLYLKACNSASNVKRKKGKIGFSWMVDVVITTPEMLVANDSSELGFISWQMLVVDEAHRLKNYSSKLMTNIRVKFNYLNCLLLTGTPIQNNISELFALLNLIDPVKFFDSVTFLEKYSDMKTKEALDELHESIRPYMLRRLKEDVEKSVPPKEETLIEVELTAFQKQYYRALYEKNHEFLKKKGRHGPSMNNLAMQLRKCCNHPFLLNGVEDEWNAQQQKDGNVSDEAESLAKASGKLVLLDKLLPKLEDDGHRILIFSQFVIMLDILQDYLRAKAYTFERLDGSITGLERQSAIERFQDEKLPGEEDKRPFIMLLSTRAGGLGINLTAADTCIIFDSDWNPQNDVQALSRCHRIGQTKNVKCFRLITRKTYEMRMFHMSSMKLGLDQAVLNGIECGAQSGKSLMTKDEAEKLLKLGAYDAYNEDKLDVESEEFLAEDIDTILQRRAYTIVHEDTGTKSNAKGGTFSKAAFTTRTSVDQNDADVDLDDPNFWTKMLGHVEVHQQHKSPVPKKRQRKVVNYIIPVSSDEDSSVVTLEKSSLKNPSSEIPSSSESDYDQDSDDDDQDDVEENTMNQLSKPDDSLKRSHSLKNNNIICKASNPNRAELEDVKPPPVNQVLKSHDSLKQYNCSNNSNITYQASNSAHSELGTQRVHQDSPNLAAYPGQTICLRIKDPSQFFGLELHETTLGSNPTLVVAIKRVLPNGFAAKTGKMSSGMILLDYHRSEQVNNRLRNGPYPIDLKFVYNNTEKYLCTADL